MNETVEQHSEKLKIKRIVTVSVILWFFDIFSESDRYRIELNKLTHTLVSVR